MMGHFDKDQSRLRRWMIVLMLAFFALAGVACEDEVVSQNPQQGQQAAPPPKSGGPKPVASAKRKAAVVENAGVSWVPRRNWERRPIEGRDPFVGFVDLIIAEQARQAELAQQQQLAEDEILLPAQEFDVRDLKLVALITNTAKPKALFIDPEGQAHKLKVGALIGNKNGVLVDIRRGEVEILQGEDMVNNPETVVMKLHPETAAGLRVEVK